MSKGPRAGESMGMKPAIARSPERSIVCWAVVGGGDPNHVHGIYSRGGITTIWKMCTLIRPVITNQVMGRAPNSRNSHDKLGHARERSARNSYNKLLTSECFARAQKARTTRGVRCTDMWMRRRYSQRDNVSPPCAFARASSKRSEIQISCTGREGGRRSGASASSYCGRTPRRRDVGVE